MLTSDIAMISFGYSYDYALHTKNEPKIHYYDSTIGANTDDIQDVIDKFKQKKKISTSALNYNGRFYTPILNGELKCASVQKCKFSTNCLNVSISKIDINNRRVVIISPDNDGSRYNKSLLYSAKKNSNYLALIKCDKNYSLESALNNFDNIRKNPEHPFNKLIHESSYKNVANTGMYPDYTSIACSYCKFNIKYNELTQETSTPISIMALHKAFISNIPTKEAISCYSSKDCIYNLQTHQNGNKNTCDHYHKIYLDQITISDIFQNYDSGLSVYINPIDFYFGKFNLETLDQNYLQSTQSLNIQNNIIAETAF